MAQPEAPPFALTPTHAASQFTIAVNPLEILLTLGQSRVGIVIENGGSVPQVVQEWFLTLSLSPPGAKTLASILNHAVDEYEKANGKISVETKLNYSSSQS